MRSSNSVSGGGFARYASSVSTASLSNCFAGTRTSSNRRCANSDIVFAASVSSCHRNPVSRPGSARVRRSRCRRAAAMIWSHASCTSSISSPETRYTGFRPAFEIARQVLRVAAASVRASAAAARGADAAHDLLDDVGCEFAAHQRCCWLLPTRLLRVDEIGARRARPAFGDQLPSPRRRRSGSGPPVRAGFGGGCPIGIRHRASGLRLLFDQIDHDCARASAAVEDLRRPTDAARASTRP